MNATVHPRSGPALLLSSAAPRTAFRSPPAIPYQPRVPVLAGILALVARVLLAGARPGTARPQPSAASRRDRCFVHAHTRALPRKTPARGTARIQQGFSKDPARERGGPPDRGPGRVQAAATKGGAS